MRVEREFSTQVAGLRYFTELIIKVSQLGLFSEKERVRGLLTRKLEEFRLYTDDLNFVERIPGKTGNAERQVVTSWFWEHACQPILTSLQLLNEVARMPDNDLQPQNFQWKIEALPCGLVTGTMGWDGITTPGRFVRLLFTSDCYHPVPDYLKDEDQGSFAVHRPYYHTDRGFCRMFYDTGYLPNGEPKGESKLLGEAWGRYFQHWDHVTREQFRDWATKNLDRLTTQGGNVPSYLTVE